MNEERLKEALLPLRKRLMRRVGKLTLLRKMGEDQLGPLKP